MQVADLSSARHLVAADLQMVNMSLRILSKPEEVRLPNIFKVRGLAYHGMDPHAVCGPWPLPSGGPQCCVHIGHCWLWPLVARLYWLWPMVT